MFSFEKLKTTCGGQLELAKTIFFEMKKEYMEAQPKYLQFYEEKNTDDAAFQFHKIINLILLALENTEIENFIRTYEKEIKNNQWQNHSEYLNVSQKFEEFLSTDF